MLSFSHPWVLLFLLIVPLLTLWQWRRPQTAWNFTQVTLLVQLAQGRTKLWQALQLLTWNLFAICLVLAIANPRWPDTQTRLPIEGVSIVLVLDVSNSMATEDFAGNVEDAAVSRLQAAQQTFRWFVQGGTLANGISLPGRPNDQIGLVTFAAVPRTECPPTFNHSVLLRVLDQQKVLAGINAGTNIGDAITEGILRLQATSTEKKILVLLSDGEHNKAGDNTLTPTQAGQIAERYSIPIYAIDCGGDGESANSEEELQQRLNGKLTLQRVAEQTHGQFFSADESDELQKVFSQIDQLNTTPVESYLFRRYFHFRQHFAMTAMLSWLGWQLLQLSIQKIPNPKWTALR